MNFNETNKNVWQEFIDYLVFFLIKEKILLYVKFLFNKPEIHVH
jgi:hypothetical protein